MRSQNLLSCSTASCGVVVVRPKSKAIIAKDAVQIAGTLGSRAGMGWAARDVKMFSITGRSWRDSGKVMCIRSMRSAKSFTLVFIRPS